MKSKNTSFLIVLGIAILAFVIAIPGSIDAQSKLRLRLAAGSPGGTYYTMSQNLQSYCAPIDLELVPTTGADASIDVMFGNKADIGIVQFDMLFKRSKGGDKDIQGLLMVQPLHPESM